MAATTSTRSKQGRDEVAPTERCSHHVSLFQRARGGDHAAWQELIIAFTPLVESAARRVGTTSSDTDDVAQEVWLLLLQHGDAIRSPECLPGWLRRVTVNVAIHHGRRRGRAYAELPEHDLLAPDLPGDDRVGLESSRHGVQRALGRLNERDRQLLELLMADDRPDYASISRRVGRPIGSIGPTRQRLLNRLRRDPAILRLVVS